MDLGLHLLVSLCFQAAVDLTCKYLIGSFKLLCDPLKNSLIDAGAH